MLTPCHASMPPAPARRVAPPPPAGVLRGARALRQPPPPARAISSAPAASTSGTTSTSTTSSIISSSGGAHAAGSSVVSSSSTGGGVELAGRPDARAEEGAAAPLHGASGVPCGGVNRRRALIAAAAAAAAMVPAAAVAPLPAAAADDRGKNVFFDVAIDGAPAGRIIVAPFDDVSVGAQRFRDLAVGRGGVGYRLNRVDGIFDTHLRVEGVKSLSYSSDGQTFIAGGDSLADLRKEMASTSARRHDAPAMVSLVVEEAEDRPITERLIARDGKLVTIQNQAGEAPNGTSFMITRTPAPDLDRTNLVVGRVVEGMDVVERLAGLPYSKPRTEWYDGPFFEAGKAMGDKRATVAEKGFNRPFKRVVIKKAGLLEGSAAPAAPATDA